MLHFSIDYIKKYSKIKIGINIRKEKIFMKNVVRIISIISIILLMCGTTIFAANVSVTGAQVSKKLYNIRNGANREKL